MGTSLYTPEPVFQPSARANIVTRRTYNRPLNDEGTVFETWDQTVDRVINHQRWLWENALGDSLLDSHETELTDLGNLIRDRKVMTAGRTLWLGGTELIKRRSSAAFNCCMAEVRTIHDVVDVFWLLLQGCGVGFKPITGTLSGFTKRMQVELVRSTRAEGGGRDSNTETFDPHSKTWRIEIGDSAEAWAKSLGKILAGKFPAKKLIIDMSQIRPAGTRLKGYGWICCGDRTLAIAYSAICDIMNRQAGKLLSKIDILDIVNWLGTVLSSRRSAQICMMDYGDHEWRSFATAKTKGFWSDNPQRSQSNNSLVFHDQPARKQLREIFDMMVAHGGAEPGFVNATQALARAPWFKGLNPSMRKGTRVLTHCGIVPIDELEGKAFRVKNMDGIWSDAACSLSGQNQQLYEITLQNGIKHYATAEHRWPVYRDGKLVKVYSRKLQEGDLLPLIQDCDLFDGSVGTKYQGFLAGAVVGSGKCYRDAGGVCIEILVTARQAREGVKDRLISVTEAIGLPPKFVRVSTLNTEQFQGYIEGEVPEWIVKSGLTEGTMSIMEFLFRAASEDFRKGFMDGLLSTTWCNGEVYPDKMPNIQFSMSSEAAMVKMVELLSFYGVLASVALLKYQPDPENLQKGIIITAASAPHFAYLFDVSYKARSEDIRQALLYDYQVEPMTRVTKVQATDLYEDVWDVSVFDVTHTFQIAGCATGNCGEILLSSAGVCNLVEIDTAKFRGDHLGIHRACRLIARANYRQAVVNLRDGVLQDTWHQTNEFLRLCGVGLTGLVSRPDLTPYDYKQLRYTAIAGAYSMADELGLERPKNVTTIKPSGTVSKIMDTTEGAHRPLGKYIFNNVIFSKHDPLVERLDRAGYYSVKHPLDEDALLIRLPICWKDVEFGVVDGKEVNRETAIEQLDRYKLLQHNWCDQNTSITVSYDPTEVPAMVDWFQKNWDSYVAVSFLFRNDPTKKAEDLGFAYLPQEVVTKETYDKYVAGLKPVDIDRVGMLDAPDEPECAGGMCPVR